MGSVEFALDDAAVLSLREQVHQNRIARQARQKRSHVDGHEDVGCLHPNQGGVHSSW